MFRIAKKPIFIYDNIDVKIKKKFIYFIKNNLKIKYFIPNYIDIIIYNNKTINLKLKKYNKKNISFIGTFRSILNNTIIGLYKGFKKELILIGIGYKVSLNNNKLLLNVGYSHIIEYIIPKNIIILCKSNTSILIKGYDKQLVGEVASRIRSFKPPESYRKGKGIRYLNEIVRIKEYKKQSK